MTRNEDMVQWLPSFSVWAVLCVVVDLFLGITGAGNTKVVMVAEKEKLFPMSLMDPSTKVVLTGEPGHLSMLDRVALASVRMVVMSRGAAWPTTSATM